VTGLRAMVRIHSALRRVESENVAARLAGGSRDQRLASQAVLITAHWDHKGIGPVIRGDSIYNGAEDNASGIAAMLGAAKALSQLPRPARSIVFLATTAEESGLLGSEAYVQRPLIPLAQTAAVLNLDVTNVRGLTRDIGALGMDRSTLGPIFEAAARGVVDRGVAARRARLVLPVRSFSIRALRCTRPVHQTGCRFRRAAQGLGQGAGEHLQRAALSPAKR